MQFSEFKKCQQSHISTMLNPRSNLFITEVNKEKMWETYLNSFPPGTNEIYRERREYDCNYCKQFIRAFGGVVIIKEDNQITSIWDFKADSTFQPVIDAVSKYVKSVPICDVFVTKEPIFGTDKNYEQKENGFHIWEHFYTKLPKEFVTKSNKSEASIRGNFRDIKNVFKRSLDEILKDAIETVLDLISQKSLYKGDEWQRVLTQFLALHDEYNRLPESEKDFYCWRKSVKVGDAIGKIRNHSIGILLTDISQGMELDGAVRRYETIMAPTNYKRPKAIFTKKMIEQAQQAITELGFLDSLGRRFATVEDITVNNILYANRDTLKQMADGVFSELQNEVSVNPKQFEKVEEIPIEHFIEYILPRTTNIELFFENRHSSNLMSVIAPKIKDSQSMFKWNNGFSWAYNGNITDSMKQRVKAAGGNVDGILRFSLQWNENGDNQNDFDAHCVEPNMNHIWFSNKGHKHPSTGMLDVDIIHPKHNQIAVENITWTSLDKMQEGLYMFYVHNYFHRGGRSGFSAEIEYDGQIYTYEYPKELRQNENVIVAKLRFSKEHGIQFVESLPSSASSKTMWGIQTNQFHPVSACMFSPNYWDEQTGIGHKHYFFILNGCLNNEQPNGFFNEFLREDLLQHKRVFEALGSKMRVDPSDDQLSGLGFSSTKRNSLVCKVEGHVTRTIKIIF